MRMQMFKAKMKVILIYLSLQLGCGLETLASQGKESGSEYILEDIDLVSRPHRCCEM